VKGLTEAHTNKIKVIGDVDSYVKSDNGIQIESGDLLYDVILYKEDVVRIHQYSSSSDTNPYSVVQEPTQTSFSIKDFDGNIIITTDQLKLVINKSPLRFIFQTVDGRVVNEDDPGLGIQVQGTQKTVYKKLQNQERFVGLGEKTGGLDRRGQGFQNWNTDHFAYGLNDDPIYASIPFYIGIHEELSYGIFLDNSYKTHFNFGASNNRFSSFSMDDGDVDYYFFSGSVSNIIQSYTWLTGRMKLPPLWSLGYQQCRYSYYPEGRVLDTAKKFRDKGIPADVMVLDIHYMDQYKIFSWDADRFPDPKGMIESLKGMGFEVVVICDPGIKTEKGYEPYDSGLRENIFLKYPDGSLYEGEVWPGWCHFPDFTMKNGRDWWSKMMKTYTGIGLKGFWNDMNEIATWGQMLPENIIFDFEETSASTRKGRNIYGLQMAQSSFDSATDLLEGERPFVLSRAGFSGIQRYSALWTGDNVSSDEHMMLGVRLVNSLGLSGVAFAGYDVGGFAGNGYNNLFARWIQLGAFSPFFRGHSMINSNDAEPWAFGEEVEEISVNYIRLRYKLLPYLYSAFLEASEIGTPVSRSLCIDYTGDENVYKSDYENQYLFGDAILVVPIGCEERYVKCFLPPGDWFEFFTDERLSGKREMIREYVIEQLPLFVKASSIIPVYPKIGSTTKEIGDELELHIYNGSTPNSKMYYEDDGISYDHENDVFHKRSINFNPEKKEITLSKAEGIYDSKIKTIKLVLHGFNMNELSKLDVQEESYAFVEPISDFDPFEKRDNDSLKIQTVHMLERNYKKEEMTFKW